MIQFNMPWEFVFPLKEEIFEILGKWGEPSMGGLSILWG